MTTGNAKQLPENVANYDLGALVDHLVDRQAIAVSLLAMIWALPAYRTTPADNLLVKVDYPRQGCEVAIYEQDAEIRIENVVYLLKCSPYKNALGEWECIEGPTGNFICFGENGTTTARISGIHYTFTPE